MNARFLIPALCLLLFLAVVGSVTTDGLASSSGTAVRLAAAAVEVNRGPAADAVAKVTPRSAPSPNVLGYYLQQTFSIGTTAFDEQSRGSQQRQIVVGPGQAIHNTFTYYPASGGAKYQDYVYYVVGNPTGGQNSVSMDNAGYGSIGIDPNSGRAIAGWNYDYHTWCGMQPSIGTAWFAESSYPAPPNCQGVVTGASEAGNVYLWPKVMGDNSAGQAVAHILALENPPPGEIGTRSLIYYKSMSGVGGPAATCGTFIDSIASFNYDIAVSPISDKVALVYSRPRVYDDPSYGDNDDVIYRESSNLGVTWGVATHVTNYADTTEVIVSWGKSYAMTAGEVSSVYDATDCLHVLFESHWADHLSHSYLVFPAKLYHWTSCEPTCIELLNDASTYGSGNGCRPPYGQHNISKISLAQSSAGRLYAVYLRNPDYDLSPDSASADCAQSGIVNGEIYVQASADLLGYTWGQPINISNTPSNGCSSGNCFSEAMPNQAPYVTDSLRIQYLLDRDAGNALRAEGVYTDNPVMNKAYPCYGPATYASLGAKPISVEWPFHTTPNAGPNHTATVAVTVTNYGNVTANYYRTVAYMTGSGWLSFDQSATGSIPAGCVNTQVVNVTATGPAAEGLYTARIDWTYMSKAELSVPVELYNFNNFFVETNADIRTAYFRMGISQNSRMAAQKDGLGQYYFGDQQDYLFDGSLLIGAGPSALSAAIYHDSAGNSLAGEPVIGRLYCSNNITVDSTSNASYRFATGMGVNRDSSIQFEVEYYAPKHPDSANFMIAKLSFYSGPRNPSATINNVVIAYACDFDVPDDSSDNTGGFDEALQLVYQRGAWLPEAQARFAGLAGLRDDGQSLTGGCVLDNGTWVYPHLGYESDSIWQKVQSTSGYSASDGTPQDLSSLLIFAKQATIRPAALGKFAVYVIIAGQMNGTLDGLKTAVVKARQFICAHFNPNLAICEQPCNCGDANGSGGSPDISDAVFLISYIFGGGPTPGPCGGNPMGMGNADGCGSISIADAYYLIGYIFFGWPLPNNCENMSPCPINIGGTVEVGCQPFSVYPGGDSVAIPIYLSCDFPLGAVSLGFYYSSGNIEITSVNIVGSEVLQHAGSHFYGYVPAENKVKFGAVWYGNNLQLSSAFYLNLNARILQGSPTQWIELDSSFVAPGAEFLLVASDGTSYRPNFAPSTTCQSGLCGNSYTDPSLNICAGGDAPFYAYLRDGLNQPVVGDSTVWVEFYNTSGIETCSKGGPLATIYPKAPSDGNGRLTFYADGGGCNTAAIARIMAPCGMIASVPARTFDVNNDQTVNLAGDWLETECNNYDGIQGNDFELFSDHLGHFCGMGPCDRIGADFVLSPDYGLMPGQTVSLRLKITNNNLQPCYVGPVDFYVSGFSTTPNPTWIARYDLNRTIAAGGTDTGTHVSYVIPGVGHGCLYAKFNPGCCGVMITKELCRVSTKNCASFPDTCYYSRIELDGSRPVYDVDIYTTQLPVDWTVDVAHVPTSFPLFTPDSVVFGICTPPPGSYTLGGNVKVPVAISYDLSGSTVATFTRWVFNENRTGDANGDCSTDISDAVYLIQYIFGGGPAPKPCQAGDANCDGTVDISDVVFLINFIFSGGAWPCVVTPELPSPSCGK